MRPEFRAYPKKFKKTVDKTQYIVYNIVVVYMLKNGLSLTKRKPPFLR